MKRQNNLINALLLASVLACTSHSEVQAQNASWQNKIQNVGSGKLNPPNGTFLNEFRMKEAVDISYTKTNNIDDNAFNKVPRDMNKLYVGWTKPGEWINYTVNVNEAGTYTMSVLYTANGDGTISFDVDGTDATGPLKISSTYDARDTVSWRQWHHWNKTDSLGSVTLKKGVHVLTLHIITNGNMNLDYMDLRTAIKNEEK
jgi:hypothetical protein